MPLLVLALSFASGCIMPQNISSKSTPSIKESFACNAWQDTNNDKTPDSAKEFIGKKSSFNVDEDLMLVSIFDIPNNKGKTWSIKIETYTGKEIMNQSRVLPSDRTIIRVGGPDEDLAGWISSNHGTGTYYASWHINGNLESSCEFTLTKSKYRIGQGAYIMGSSEKLTDVARRFDVDIKDILIFNNIRDPRKVRAGQKIILWPTITEYITKKGEWLTKIARDHNTTVTLIKRINALKSDSLKPGQKLFIPTNPNT